MLIAETAIITAAITTTVRIIAETAIITVAAIKKLMATQTAMPEVLMQKINQMKPHLQQEMMQIAKVVGLIFTKI
jgi:ABC-type phosphate transport system permease subunit